jgi:putative hydrolase of the HAD superfamily
MSVIFPLSNPQKYWSELAKNPQVCWLFDYDLTLYPHEESGVLHSLDSRINAFLGEYLKADAEEADRLRRKYWQAHGTTLAGLMADRDLDPHVYFDFIHQGDLQRPQSNPDLRQWLETLGGPSYIFTNARADWAEVGLDCIGIRECFEGIYDLERLGWLGKPEAAPYHQIQRELGLRPQSSVVFLDDKLENLATASRLGWTCVWIAGTQAEAYDVSKTHTFEQFGITHPIWVVERLMDLSKWTQDVSVEWVNPVGSDTDSDAEEIQEEQHWVTDPQLQLELWEHLFLEPYKLLLKCRREAYQASGAGGQKRNRVMSGIRLIHPSGIRAQDCSGREAQRNLETALFKLRIEMAWAAAESLPENFKILEMIAPFAANKISLEHEKYPLILAWILHVLKATHGDVSKLAKATGWTSSAWVRQIHKDSRLWQEVQALRSAGGRPLLKSGR